LLLRPFFFWGAGEGIYLLALVSYLHLVYTYRMAITKVFRSGNSQAVRIPKQFRFRSQQVEITKRGNEIVLRERGANLSAAFELLSGLSPDFFKGGRRQPKLDERDKL
jgi:antitoxin VapB